MSTLKTNAITTVAGKPILNSTGSVLQVVEGFLPAATSTTSGSGLDPVYVATALTASITPTSTTSRILVLVTVNIQNDTGNGGCYGAVYRNASLQLYSVLSQYQANGNTVIHAGMNLMDSPVTTSATTYTYYHSRYNTGTAYLSNGRIYLLEVSA
jgi:K+-transporting ATPase c subunit